MRRSTLLTALTLVAATAPGRVAQLTRPLPDGEEELPEGTGGR